ncbi:ATP-dependent RNA helicase DEAH13 [Oryza brachyantha]|uniref:RNA helicase n=1 Tax=Oryza brachyantha TaxID=4533 RepID=J3LGV7_ORYBR|nr:ATP-dependent RNA helicase DEAH13 [Oryza brachyantha]XP_015689549.1 ATP-dependent RNA helicase DEAH13 [Oryza brachyantha]
MEDSNALILPCKRKNKAQGKAKDGKKIKEDPKMSKTKLKKLQKLEEEKQKKLLQAKSIEILRKHKISDDAYSLLHASGSIGQAETLKERRRRAVQFSKAGFDVPEELSLFKKDGDKIVPENSESSEEISPQKFVDSAKSEDTLRQCKNDINSDATNPVKCKLITDVGLSNQEPKTEVADDVPNMLANQIIQSSIPSYSGKEIDVQDKEPGHEECIVQECFNPPIVVPVSRPHDVEKTRRDLPIIMMEQEMMEAIYENSVVILCGETGCGKTTQVPQFLYEAGFGTSNRADRKGIIGITQPRRVAVLATARRVSYELGLKLGKEVGFQVRHDKMVGSKCSIKFMTDGILLREVQSDFLLKRYSVIILDEAHERSLNTDILIGMLSRIIKIRKSLYIEQQEKIHCGLSIDPEEKISQLKVVLMSATLQLKDFISNRRLFDVIPPAIKVPVRQFPVTVHFSKSTHDDYLGQAYKKVMSIHKRLPPGGILVFVTGQREVDYLCKKLQRASKQQTDKKTENVEGDGNGLSPEVDEREISEAYDIDIDESDHQDDMFCSYDEDESNAGPSVDSSDIEMEPEMDTDSEDDDSVSYETTEEDGPVLAFLKGAEGSSVLKASFKAISRVSGEPESIDIPSDSAILEESIHAPFSKCTEPRPVSLGKLRVLPLYAMLPASQQLRVFQDIPDGERLVVVATNVAETSLTIPGIKYVVDTGKQKVKNYNHATGMATYEIQWISKASASQRSGRAGRTGPGHCYRLYSAAAYGKDELFPEFSEPEIKKIPVDGVVLMLKFMDINKVANFPFPTPPDKESLVEAERCLEVLEALDSKGTLTPMGRAMAQYPMSPRHSRLLLTIIKILKSQQGFSRSNFILGYAAAAASALSFTNPFLMQNEFSGESKDNPESEDKDQQERKRQKKLKAMVREAHAKFSNPSSDALTISRALQLFELSESPVEFCRVNSLHLKTMEEMSKLRKQLLRLIFHHSKSCEEFSWKLGGFEDVEEAWRYESDKKPMQLNEEELLGQGICAGWADRVAKRIRAFSGSSKDDRKVRAVHYQSCALNDTVYLHRSSYVAQIAPEFVVYSELVHTKRSYMHGVTGVKPGWILKYASSLCTFSAPLEDPKPYYDPQKDQVYCYVSPIFSRHNWQLPLHSLPIKDDTSRLQVFACALLKGDVLPCLKVIQKFLALSPSVLLGPVSQRRVGDLLNRMKIGSKLIDSRTALRDKWKVNPDFLYPEIKAWFQDKFHGQFGAIWEQMHQEVVLEGDELFPKRYKKVKANQF